MDSRPSSEPAPARRRIIFVFALLAAVTSGCVTVKPQEKELLADPAMVYGSGGQAQRHEEHVLDSRAGAHSSSSSAGGCGCN